MTNTTPKTIREKIVSGFTNFWWYAPEYFNRWRVFPRIFISVYIYILWRVVEWFMLLPDPNTQQAGLVSVIVGAGAAWFGLYLNATDDVASPDVPPPSER